MFDRMKRVFLRLFLVIALFVMIFPLSAGAEEEPDDRDPKLVGLLVPECDTPANSILVQADALKAKGNFRAALKGYQEVLRLYPTSLFPLSRLVLLNMTLSSPFEIFWLILY